VLESIAYEVRLNVEAMGVQLRAPVADGGLSRSEFFNRMLAEVLGVPVRMGATPEATSLKLKGLFSAV